MTHQMPSPSVLRCEYVENPLGLDVKAPRLSWQVETCARNWRQSAYQVLVASSAENLANGTGDLWDTGRVASAESTQIAYMGKPLCSGQRCYWAVRVWNQNGEPSAYSSPAWWEMALLDPSDWQAKWIGAPGGSLGSWYNPVRPAPYLRREFSARKPVQSARAYICGLGYYEMYVNGQRIGDHMLDPLVTRYDVRSLYVTHDVTAQIQTGTNAIGVVLGNGWYNCHTAEVWHFDKAPWRDYPKLLLQIAITYTDGSSELIVSDATWRVSTGPIIFDGLRNGETYDARKELPGWNVPGYDDSAWNHAVVTPGPGGLLRAQPLAPIKVTRSIPPISVQEVKPGVFVYDIGQNLAGWAQLKVSGPAGTEVVMRYAEKLTADGDIDQSNINSFIRSGECQTDRYILKGTGIEVWEPHFTYHGFRYVQVTGLPGRPALDSITARVVHTAFTPAGAFACSNALLNRIQECTQWSYISNFVGIPTDCPHREKNGWTGDAQLAAETGLFNYAAVTAYTKWLDDIADVQRPNGQLPGIVPTGGWGFNWGSGPAWDSAYTHIPWYLYLYLGDKRILEQHYAGMKLYVDYMTQMATDHIVSFGLGDWCPVDRQTMTPVALTSSGYYHANCRILAHAAELLGKSDDAQHYRSLAEQIRQACNRAFYDPATGKYADGQQTSQACALFQGLVEPAEYAKVFTQLLAAINTHNGHLDYGILGAKYVPNALTAGGHTDVAYAMATKTDFPSYGHWLGQGATTLWEDWRGQSSRNHIMFGDISAWMYKALAGINPDAEQPGFRHTIIRPCLVDGLTWVKATHQSPYGLIRSAWNREGARVRLNVTIPANTSATVYVPYPEVDGITESGVSAKEAAGVTYLGSEAGASTFRVGSGEYQFEW